MTNSEKYDNMVTGIVSGFFLPVIVGLIIFICTARGMSIPQYMNRIAEAHIVTHAITLCVFPNLIIFFIYNRFDMLRAVRGVLAITIVWAITVFIVKFI